MKGSLMLDYSLIKDEELVKLSKNNDNEAFAVLTERYIPTAMYHASRFSGLYTEKEDLAQEGILGFIAAVYSFDESKGFAFSTFAGSCIRNRIISAVRTISSKKQIPLELIVPLEEQSNSASDEKTPEESLISQAEIERIGSLIDSELTEKEKSVFLLFLQGMTYEQIAQKTSVTPKSVDGTLQRVRKKLREKLS